MIATYRLQLQPDFGFDRVRELMPYFRQLGVSHLYLSPITQSRLGSTHGYDVIDHNQVRDELGGRERFQALVEAARSHDLRLILDFVPNHAGVGPRNVAWQDVLAYGPHSPSAKYFDVDWRPIKPELNGKMLLPFLGKPYGETLDGGELKLAYQDGSFYLTYHESRFALNPGSYGDLLAHALRHYERQDLYWNLKDLVEAYQTVAPPEREKAEALRPRLTALAPQVDFQRVLDELSTDALHDLLEQQFWRLSYWKTAGYEINYRRFFDINDLVALRMEDPVVFWDAHRLLAELLALEAVDGVRIDHVDGLTDPHLYLSRLKRLGARHIWVEKILAHGETMPNEWPVEGTTGYEFMNDMLGTLVYPGGEIPLTRAYERFVPGALPYEEVLHRSKRLVMETSLSSELFRLAYGLDRLSEADYHTRDFTLESLRDALGEIVAAFDRYRTYLPYDREQAREVIRRAVYEARRRNPAAEPSVFEFIGQVLLSEMWTEPGEQQEAWTRRFQQYTAPVAAKGVEDTAFYRYLRLVALNEVGGEPDRFGLPLQAFHSHARFRAHRYPSNLLATATHDHKRGEDTRMRLLGLSEQAEAWQELVAQLVHLAPRHRGEHGPAPEAEYLFYQILVTLHDTDTPEKLADRIVAYMRKAVNEAKRHTSWLNPDPDYEQDLERFVRNMLADEEVTALVRPMARSLARFGVTGSIGQLVVKITTPGVPDFYQGTEFMDFSLVDPDNRRGVDYDLRRRLLDGFSRLLEAPEEEAVRQLVETDADRLKCFVTARLLRFRREHPELFSGGYEPVEAEGEQADHLVAYTRESDREVLLVVITRYPAVLDAAGGWSDAALPLPEALHGIRWTELLTGRSVEPAPRLSPAALPLPWAVLHGVR